MTAANGVVGIDWYAPPNPRIGKLNNIDLAWHPEQRTASIRRNGDDTEYISLLMVGVFVIRRRVKMSACLAC